MKISVIAAIGRNRAIGKDNRLLWRLPLDMKFFRDTTMGHPVITGRRNYESIPEAFRPLPGRLNIVLTRNTDFKAPGALITSNLNDAIELAAGHNSEEIFIIGGGKVYAEAMAGGRVNKLYITHVDDEPEADTFFPEWDEKQWNMVHEERHETDERHAQAFVVRVYERVHS